jgi:hypothetical protein
LGRKSIILNVPYFSTEKKGSFFLIGNVCLQFVAAQANKGREGDDGERTAKGVIIGLVGTRWVGKQHVLTTYSIMMALTTRSNNLFYHDGSNNTLYGVMALTT